MSLAELQRSSDLTGRVLDHVPAGVVHVGADGAILAANSEALAILGLKYDDLTSRWVKDFEPETIREDGSAFPVSEYPITKALQTGESQPPATIGVRRGARVSWAIYRAVPIVDETGKATSAVATFLDITEQKQAQAALRASEEKWRSLAQSVSDFIIIVALDMRVLSLNRYARGFTEDETIGTSSLNYIFSDDHTLFREAFEGVIATGIPARVECRGAGDGGEMRWYETSMAPLRGERGIEAAVLVARDVTEHRALLRKLAEKERLAGVGMLAASVAHEINNPLTYVLANLEFALNPRRTDAELRDRALRDAYAGAERVRQIVRDLKILARPERDDLVFVDLEPVVSAALRLAGPEVSHRASVELALEGAPSVVGSESQLVQVFINLLVNAAHAIEERGAGPRRIRVSTRPELEGDLVGIDVRDDGGGIRTEDLGRIFHPFYTTKVLGSGTGLGLSICRDIVDRAGGRIDVTSELGHGSTFTVWWPTSRASARRPEPQPPSASAPRMRVLVVDDDAMVAQALVRAVEEHHEAVAAHSGRAALEAVRKSRFDVVVCDLMMPDLGGLALHELVMGICPELAQHFVFVTGGLIGPETSEMLVRSGALVLRKPFGAVELLAAIGESSRRAPSRRAQSTSSPWPT